MSLAFRFPVFALVLFVIAGCVESTGAADGCKSTCKVKCSESVGPNELTKAQKKDGWVLLFDGKAMADWVSIGKDKFPASGWEIKDGVLTVNPVGHDRKVRPGGIVTVKAYDDFDFRLDFKITKGANSGIKYFIREEDVKKGNELGLEFQILDDKVHPDAKKGRDGNRTVGSLYDLIAADKGKNVNPIGQWNRARIVSKGRHVEHWLNGKKTLEFDRDSNEFADLLEISKYKKYDGFGLAKKGHILLQDHRNTVSFRNVMVRELK